MKKSFTLIEILVVISIIGLLAAVAAVSYSTLNRNARDARRKADIEQIRAALEMYRSNDPLSQYPAFQGSCASLLTSVPSMATYLPRVPPDPKASSNYNYGCYITISSYTLGAALETLTVSCPAIPGGVNCGSGPTYGCTYNAGPYGQTCP